MCMGTCFLQSLIKLTSQTLSAQTGKVCANKIVPDQTAPKEQSDLGLFAQTFFSKIIINKERIVQIIN